MQRDAAPPPAQRSVEEEKKSAYIDLLMDLAKADGADVAGRMDLLNRLERAIGIQGSGDSKPPE